MTIIKHTLPDYKEISILPLADLHMGDINCDSDTLIRVSSLPGYWPGMYCCPSPLPAAVGDVIVIIRHGGVTD